MRRVLIALSVVLALLALAAPAHALISELGPDGPLPAPNCPASPCLVVGRTTALPSKVGATLNPMAAPRAGRIVAVTLRLARPTASQIAYLDGRLGGPASVRVSVLKPSKDRRRYRLQSQSEPIALGPWFGRTAQLALVQTLPIQRGWVVALTVPTWAPVLATGVARTNGWRASRPRGGCADTVAQTAHQALGSLKPYPCLYRGERIAYSATLISSP